MSNIKINSFYAYQRACREYMPYMSRINESSVRELYWFVNDANHRIIDWVSGNGKLDDSYVLEMVKKSEPLFNKCLSDEQKSDFIKWVGCYEEERLYRENIMLKNKLDEYRELLEHNGIEVY